MNITKYIPFVRIDFEKSIPILRFIHPYASIEFDKNNKIDIR